MWHYYARYRKTCSKPTFTRSKKSGPAGAFSVYRLIWLALSREDALTQKQTRELAQAFALSTQVATALTLAQAFVKLLRDQQVEALPGWLESAQASPIRELRQFAESALSGIAPLWKRHSAEKSSNGQTEGKAEFAEMSQKANVWASHVCSSAPAHAALCMSFHAK
jgi:hypothetical protein